MARPPTMRTQPAPNSRAESDALDRLAEAEETLRAIGAGEVDAFVVSDGGTGQLVYTLSTADRPYRMFVENMRDGAATLSSGGLVMYANRRLAELLSCSTDMIVGSPLTNFLAEDNPISIDEIRGPGGRGVTFELELLDGDGVVVPVLIGSSPLEVDGDLLTCLTITDLTAQKAQEHEIARLGEAQAERLVDLQQAQAALTQRATHDSLTGLPNRALLVDRVDQALAQSKRLGGCTAVYFVDLDHFKRINDTRGHAAGDAVLQNVAERLVEVLRPMDTVARIGGDEFAVLAPDVDSHQHAFDIGVRLVRELSVGVGDAERDRSAASVGVSVSVGGRGTAESMLREADAAMYRAKLLGRGRVEVFDAALGEEIQRRSDAQRMLQSALDDHRLVLYYQPIVELAGIRMAGFEGLARIEERDGSILAPTEFISVAEDSGLVVPLGEQVLRLACREVHEWNQGRRAADGLTIAVNVSARQLQRGDLAVVVGATLAEIGLDPGCLHLELTETSVMDLDSGVVEQLRSIRDLGVEIGLDDFGTGYASLTHLRRLPLTFVKIDQSFVQGIGVDEGDERIVAAVVDLAANLGLRSVAEGVETPDQRDRLRAFGCDQAQGYLFARPMPPGDVPAVIEQLDW
jgi:diguanylate cyclase (GGDEF)-like protein/PAS domain S-box-containing protein